MFLTSNSEQVRKPTKTLEECHTLCVRCASTWESDELENRMVLRSRETQDQKDIDKLIFVQIMISGPQS